MKSIIKLLKPKSNTIKMVSFSVVASVVTFGSMFIVTLVIASYWGIWSAFIYGLVIIVIFFLSLTWRVYPRKKNLFFYNSSGRFEVFDIVYDRGSATRPTIPGFLKHDGESWFVVYEDGFEWPLSDFRNAELFIYQSNGN